MTEQMDHTDRNGSANPRDALQETAGDDTTAGDDRGAAAGHPAGISRRRLLGTAAVHDGGDVP
ncbi:hypothetical protein, partial [Streptomyces sp. GC420]|uniref:hypothetical protein n=1 Tax=Streptomyces sp. GC420 TaxID=2697568 RepID=UPI001414FAB1